MTCIIGIEHDGKCYVGGDSAGVGGYNLVIRRDEKIFVKDQFVFGFTSSFRMGQVLRYCFTPPKHHPDQEIMEYMVVDFINQVRSTFKEAGWTPNDDTVGKGIEQSGTFIVGYHGRIFEIEDDLQVASPMNGIASCGCGRDIAYGAMEALSKYVNDPELRIREALAIVERNNCGVHAPFVVKNV
jgi:ATP-dependent protease HslVU (ClpYQ) peptidase subunit